MKLIISLVLILPTHLYAMIQIQSALIEKGQIVKNIFINKYDVPEMLITLNETKENCKMCSKDIAVCLCINKKGELKLLSLDMKILKNSFKVFKTPTRGEL